jgi:hypothetical protein
MEVLQKRGGDEANEAADLRDVPNGVSHDTGADMHGAKGITGLTPFFFLFLASPWSSYLLAV